MTKRNLAKSFRRKPAPPPEPLPTGRYFWTDPCPACRGSGRVTPGRVDGWYVDYHYQDGHETCGPYAKALAVEMVRTSDRVSATLIGPDGQIYGVQS